MHKRSSEEVFKEIKLLKREVRRLALLIKELYELAVDDTTDVEGVTATICDNSEVPYDVLLYENALKEKFKSNHARKEGYRPSTPEIKRLAKENGGSITVY